MFFPIDEVEQNMWSTHSEFKLVKELKLCGILPENMLYDRSLEIEQLVHVYHCGLWSNEDNSMHKQSERKESHSQRC
jgi:hypothetical protein